MKKIQGIPASPGIAIGPIYLHEPDDPWISIRRITDVKPEIVRFLETLDEVGRDLKMTQTHVKERLGVDHARIFDVHLLILNDDALKAPTIRLIKKEKFNAEYAFWLTLQKIRRQFEMIKDHHFVARKADVLDVERQVLAKLCQQKGVLLDRLNEEAIVFSHDLGPSDTAYMQRDGVLGLVTEVGGTTSHTAILARGLEIPAAVGVKTAIALAEPGVLAIVDGERGLVTIDPDSETLARYRKEAKKFQEIRKNLSDSKDLLSVTSDGVRVELQGNIELPEEVEALLSYGADGIGLYRTEYLYLTGQELPTEEDQAKAYSFLAEKISPRPLVIRTLDLGGDKLSHRLGTKPEINPFLGCRAIRLSLANKALFRVQLKAILRASAKGNIRVMFPLISNIEELIKAKQLLKEACLDLRSQGVAFDEKILIGVMVEVPSAALIADQLSKEVDFFSIGTNDLIQYTIAVDRGNEEVAYLYDPLHPAVLRLIKSVVDFGHSGDIPVTVCGEMAGDPFCSVLLLGLGVDGLSMSPRALPEVKRVIRAISTGEAKEIAESVLALRAGEEIQGYLHQRVLNLIGPSLSKGLSEK